MEDTKFYHYERKLKIEHLSLRNHLLSILKDSEIVKQISTVLSRYPCLGNKRNGCWYSHEYDNYCHFKSTDGHEGKWYFSLNRLNVETLKLSLRNGGVIIIDSTRR
jgi:hypothetical protein